jgi:hypothetical protein
MKLAEAISQTNPLVVKAVAASTLIDVEGLGYAGCCSELESTLRSISYIQPSLLRCLPPAFSIIITLLENQGEPLSLSELRAMSTLHAGALHERIASGEILGGDDARLYRRVLHAAWQTGLVLDASELSVLGVLRNELGLHFVDHFLICYHAELSNLLQSEDAFLRELQGLEAAMLLFYSDAGYTIAEEARAAIATAVGVPLSERGRRRLFEWIGNGELAEVLRLSDLPISGSKTERIERVIARMLPAATVLQVVPIADLHSIAEGVGCTKSGNKDQLIARLIDHFGRDQDIPRPAPESPAPVTEPKLLRQSDFCRLFENFSGRELSDILDSFDDITKSGSKAVRIENLWASRYGEMTLLSQLQNRQLENALEHLGLRIGGSKTERVIRLMKWAESSVESETDGAVGSEID